MAQTLGAQLVPITSINEYRWQQLDQPESHFSAAKRNRNRGVFLSYRGWKKLNQAGVLHNEFGERYTYEQLSERSHLNERTVSRLLSCETKVDKNTLKTFFRTFNLSLEAGDYITVKRDRTDEITPNLSAGAIATIPKAQFEQIVEELTQLKQRMKEYEHLFYQLRINENHAGQHLRA
ncbi:MAG TPA: hypothetical protein V6C78_26550 [Crinalium sp.]|jgi:transcriptional regulator with XRE-family HTH domain